VALGINYLLKSRYHRALKWTGCAILIIPLSLGIFFEFGFKKLLNIDPISEMDIRFIAIGHGYGRPGNNKVPYDPLKNLAERVLSKKSFDFYIFLGDTVREASDIPEFLKWANSLKQRRVFVRGNHEGDAYNFSRLSNQPKTYYSFEDDANSFIVLDANRSGWSLDEDQLEFLKGTISKSDKKNIFIFVHQITWTERLEPFNIENSDYLKEGISDFEETLLPYLLQIGKPVYIISGDSGAYPSSLSFFYGRTTNVHMIATGMGGGKGVDCILAVGMHEGEIKVMPIFFDENGEIIEQIYTEVFHPNFDYAYTVKQGLSLKLFFKLIYLGFTKLRLDIL